MGIYLDENGNPIPPGPSRNNNPAAPPPPPTTPAPPTPPAPAPTPAPGGLAPVVKDPRNAAGRGVPVEQYFQDWVKNFGIKADQAGMDQLIAHMRNEGYDVKRADHNGQPSKDKIDLGNGQSSDILFSEGTADAKWVWQPYATGSSGGSGGTLGGGAFDMSTYDTGPFTKPWGGSLPTFEKAAPFTPTSAADVLADPGYKFRLDQGQHALVNSQAARGLANTGGSIKDFDAWTQSLASNEFAQADARRRNDYSLNYGTQTLDPYTFAYQNAVQNYSIFRNRQNDSYDKIFQTNSA